MQHFLNRHIQLFETSRLAGMMSSHIIYYDCLGFCSFKRFRLINSQFLVNWIIYVLKRWDSVKLLSSIKDKPDILWYMKDIFVGTIVWLLRVNHYKSVFVLHFSDFILLIIVLGVSNQGSICNTRQAKILRKRCFMLRALNKNIYRRGYIYE